MTNSPEMVFVIYALAKLGAAPALINSNLKGDPLQYCTNLAGSKYIICSPDTVQSALTLPATAASECPGQGLVVVDFGSFPRSEKPDGQVISITPSDPHHGREVAKAKRRPIDIAALVYTSGTTGMPKACSVKNMHMCIVSTPTTPDTDKPKYYFPVRTYTSMPLFHGTSLFTGLCYSVGTSGALCLGRKFSATRHFEEIRRSRATRMLYVGELCRYLLAQPPSPHDRGHGCIVAMGNGLQKDVWMNFKKRFGIPEIREFYRSTEGLAKYDNRHLHNKFGAGYVGYKGLVRRWLEDDCFIIKFDEASQQPYRDRRTGFCVPASPNEPGEAIGRIRSLATYTDYLHNQDATDAKILRNVFADGDMFQRSGDLVIQDRWGWIRFYDRVGDTFRWKGENVSAGEIAGYISDMPEVLEAIVVGRKMDGYDGQMGTAAVALTQLSKDAEVAFVGKLPGVFKHRGVPQYAVPRLLAMVDRLDVGASFKHDKQIWKKEQWDPAEPSQASSRYWLDGDTYRVLDGAAWMKIQNGLAKL
ncbi:bifunctional fatty acid transporter and acyl-CoA synthetase [Eremomyces bilateralis CBS 781.70]|uniref:Bifunctional fatty acid transporter and acyl-CoA synthetase n=1 Tax=Eremomyces bilateralis CBS 781.70 TaxID=1392243 RepID=A0A6G1FSS2_9PEZI|nr:bifunctional fatty acid transporter and acyl-CoA synthetase [Eremomyces bilateralis CBS 781.70]KAF1808915.1 bifunctional fatty acid transporter and acyl-CoA synthetase [Eremomyces bilateralis CBS 781.70]